MREIIYKKFYHNFIINFNFSSHFNKIAENHISLVKREYVKDKNKNKTSAPIGSKPKIDFTLDKVIFSFYQISEVYLGFSTFLNQENYVKTIFSGRAHWQ